MDSVDGLRYIMTFAADTSDFDAKVKRMKADLASMGKAAASASAAAVSGATAPKTRAVKKELTDAEKQAKGFEAWQAKSDDRRNKWSREMAKNEAKERAERERANARDERENKRQDGVLAKARVQKVLGDQKTEKDKVRDNARADALGRRQAAARVQAEKEDAKRFAANNPMQQKKMTEREEAQQRQKMRRYEKDWADAKKENDRRSGKGGAAEDDGKDGFMGKASALVVGMELHKAQMFAQGVADGVWNAVEAVGQLFVSTTREAAAFEDMQSGLKFAFGDKAEDIFSKVQQEAVKLTFTLEETSDLVRSLGIMKINPFGDGKDIKTFTSRTGEAITALEALQDTASATGKGTKAVMIAVREYMGGNNVSLARRFDIPLTEVKEWRKETDKGLNQQEQAMLLFGKIAGKYGGATRMREENFNFVMAQFPDLINKQIQPKLGLGAIKAMTPGLRALKDALQDLANSDKAMGNLAEVFTVIGHAVSGMLRVSAAVLRMLTTLVEVQPHLPLLVAGFLAFGAAAVFVTASMTAMGLSLAVVAAGIAALGWELAAIALVPTLIAGTVAAVAFAGGAALMTGAFFSAKQPVSGFVETLKNAKLMITALHEAFVNWKDGVSAISDETGDALEAAGIRGWFEEIIRWADRAEKFVRGFGKGFDEAVGPATRKVGQAFDMIVESVTRLFVALGLLAPAAETSGEEAASAGEKMGQRIGEAVNLVLFAVERVNTAFNVMVQMAPEVIRSLAEVWGTGRLIWNVFTMVSRVIVGIGEFIWAGLVSPMEVLYHKTAKWVDYLRAGYAFMSGDKKGAGELLMAAADHDKAAGNAMLAAPGKMLQGMEDAVVGTAKGVEQDLTDIDNGGQQATAAREFADKLEWSLKNVGESRDEAAATRARQGLAPLSANELTSHGPAPRLESYNEYQLAENGPRGPMNYDPSVKSPVNVMQQPIVIQVDKRVLGEVMASYIDDISSGQGAVMTQESKLWPSRK